MQIVKLMLVLSLGAGQALWAEEGKGACTSAFRTISAEADQAIEEIRTAEFPPNPRGGAMTWGSITAGCVVVTLAFTGGLTTLGCGIPALMTTGFGYRWYKTSGPVGQIQDIRYIYAVYTGEEKVGDEVTAVYAQELVKERMDSGQLCDLNGQPNISWEELEAELSVSER